MKPARGLLACRLGALINVIMRPTKDVIRIIVIIVKLLAINPVQGSSSSSTSLLHPQSALALLPSRFRPPT